MTIEHALNLSRAPVEISVITPTLNEAKNLPELLRRIDAALAGRAYEVIVVDDASTDDTPALCAELEKHYPLRLRVRSEAHGGLAGAVLEGFSLARGNVFVTMDADLQHPPEKIPEILAALERGSEGGARAAEFALGSRYAAGGSTAEKWGPVRRLNSWIATVLARPFCGRTSDPMSGFFALRRETYERAQRLLPLGYKVGLELMCKCRVREVREVPIHFDARAHGQSKLTLAQQFKYLEHLSRLYDFCYPRASPIAKFLITTGCGWFVGFAAFITMVRLFPDRSGVAVPVAYLGTIATTVVFHLRYVRTQREFLATRHPWRDFLVTVLCEFIAATATGLWLIRRVQVLYAWELFLIAWSAATVTRYVLRKELMQDVRGLRRGVREEELDAEGLKAEKD
jgi:glycosyltransferase involved in cell wall biosynthesis